MLAFIYSFTWFLAVFITLANVFLALYIFMKLDREKKLSAGMHELKRVIYFYCVGAMLVIIISVVLFFWSTV